MCHNYNLFLINWFYDVLCILNSLWGTFDPSIHLNGWKLPPLLYLNVKEEIHLGQTKYSYFASSSYGFNVFARNCDNFFYSEIITQIYILEIFSSTSDFKRHTKVCEDSGSWGKGWFTERKEYGTDVCEGRTNSKACFCWIVCCWGYKLRFTQMGTSGIFYEVSFLWFLFHASFNIYC